MTRFIRRVGRLHAVLVVAAVLAAALAATAGPAAADYGSAAAYQVEITANDSHGGIWLWIELTPSDSSATSGTGDYSGSDCGHGHGAASDTGDVTWSSSGGTLTISGVVLNGFPPTIGPVPVTITVPSSYGHYSYPTDAYDSIFSGLPPFVTDGHAQVQVAP